jgi:hypothetical protein
MLCKKHETSAGLESYQLNAKPKRRRLMTEMTTRIPARRKARSKKVTVVRKLLKVNPHIKALEVSDKLKITRAYAYLLLADAKIIKHRAQPIVEAPQVIMYEPMTEPDKDVPTVDLVNHPPHYRMGGIETIDFIEAKCLNYNLGNVIKYITRADHKGSKLEDLRKAQWYLTREIEQSE